MDLVVRPIDTWPGRPLRDESDRKQTRFTSGWSETQDLLEREVGYLAGQHERLVLQLAITERDCRNDGWIRSDAQPRHPGVIVSFTDLATGRPMQISTDRFTKNWGTKYLNGWKSNVRAVALGLQHLRMVNDYGIADDGQQYVGWQAISSESSVALGNGQMTPRDAARALLDAAHLRTDDESITNFLADRGHWKLVYRKAADNMHPDKPTGSEQAFKLVSEAKAVLDKL